MSIFNIDGWIGDDTVREFEMKTGIPVVRAVPVEPTK